MDARRSYRGDVDVGRTEAVQFSQAVELFGDDDVVAAPVDTGVLALDEGLAVGSTVVDPRMASK